MYRREIYTADPGYIGVDIWDFAHWHTWKVQSLSFMWFLSAPMTIMSLVSNGLLTQQKGLGVFAE